MRYENGLPGWARPRDVKKEQENDFLQTYDRVNTYTADLPEKYRKNKVAPDQSQRRAHVDPNNSWV